MPNRSRVLAVAALLVGAIGSYIWLSADGGGGSKKVATVHAAPQAALRMAMHYMPLASPFVAVVQTNVSSPSVLAAAQLAQRLPGFGQAFAALEALAKKYTGLDVVNQLPELLGNPIVAAGSPGQALLAWQTGSSAGLEAAINASIDSGALAAAGTYESTSIYMGVGGTALAAAGPVVVAGNSLAVVRAAIDRGARSAGALTPTAFESRATGLPKDALVRAVASGSGMQSLLTAAYPSLAQIPWVAALSRGGLALSAASDGLHGVVRLDTSPGVLTAADMPIAQGATAPVLHGGAAVTVGIHDLAHLGQFLLDAGDATNSQLVSGYRDVDNLLTRFARIDLDQDVLGTLTGSATISTDDLSHFTVRADTTDPSGVADVLSRIGTLGSVGGFLGVDLGGYSVSTDSDLVTISHNDTPLVTLGVRNDVLVASNDPNADFDAIASAPERGAGPPPRGSLRAVIRPSVLLDLLTTRLGLPENVRVLLEPLRQAIVTARATGGNITAQVFLPVAN